ncbi:CDP-glucose 4,6-dehydratase [Bradyrhizobium sp. RT3b]|uniref:CDP-glucose 4,6-dehydratase n=1 Tax=Bradyrhizobium sp. RT3b TaxID=3156334 RepID=UPI00339471FF
MRQIDRQFWKGRRVFVTGHMGFKGAWLCSLLARLGAETFGFGKDERERLLYRELKLARHSGRVGDINDVNALRAALAGFETDVLFHLAAQPIVLTSYADPVGTFETNVVGTVRVLDAARAAVGLRAIVVITSDKVYQNDETSRAYHEQDALGGADPYSASKAAAEIATRAMAHSFFSESDAARIATARAGNVIGGGDWAEFRLLPDAARAIGCGQPLICRNPKSVRPWQHVLDPLAGYVMLAEDLACAKASSDAWNFGPAPDDILTVGDVANLFVEAWGREAKWMAELNQNGAHHEAKLLTIDSGCAQRELGWQPRWRSAEAVQRTAAWYRDHAAGTSAMSLVERDISEFLDVRSPR